MNPTLNINTSTTKSKNLMQNTNVSLITHRPRPTIKLPRIQLFKTGFRKLSILSKILGMMQMAVRGGSPYLRHYDALHTKIDM